MNYSEILKLLVGISPHCMQEFYLNTLIDQQCLLHGLLMQQLAWTSEKRFRGWKLQTLGHEKNTTKAAEHADGNLKMTFLPVFAKLHIFPKTSYINQHSDSTRLIWAKTTVRHAHVFSTCNSHYKPLE